MLQVSQFSAQELEYLTKCDDLAAVAVELGERFTSAGQNWGRATATKTGAVGRGRFGVAGFTGGEYPAMLIWITVTEEVALLWTWLGPDPGLPDVKQAFELVLSACT